MTAATYSLHVEDSGRGVPVVALHSSGLSARQWRRLASALTDQGFRAVVPDLVGHGRSPEWPETAPFTFDVDVEHVSELLESLGEPVHLVGHSYGAFVGLLAARAAPSRIRSLVLYEPVAFGLLDPVKDVDAAEELKAVGMTWDPSPEGRERWLESFVDYWGGSGAWTALREDARAEFRRVAWVMHRAVVSLVKDETPASAYEGIEAPVLLMTGERSTLAAHAVIRRLAAALRDARVRTVPGAGHMGPLSHAEVVNGAIVEWIRTV
ncbi:MAG TPA: alpha/beta hydrolase [Polyangiaceae bacterium]|jgi:pimeloyl-ACP methyl ester carboxylesterase